MPSKFEWDAGEVTYQPPEAGAGEDDVAAEIARIDRILEEAGEDPASLEDAEFEDASTIATLYVQRKVLNARAIHAWAKASGLVNLVPPEELHVTICYSSAPVDWMEMGQPFEEEMRVPAGGPRMVQILGEYAAALLFSSSALKWRHQDMVEAGVRHDWPEYLPHITVATGEQLALASVVPYTGEILLGPEIFEEVKI